MPLNICTILLSAISIIVTIIFGAATIWLALLIYARQKRESAELVALGAGRIIRALVVAGVISREQEERARQVAAGEIQRFQETPVVHMPKLTMTVLDELIKHGSDQSGLKTDPSSKAAYGPEGPGGFTRTG